MKCVIPEISWHNRDPVLSIDIQPKLVKDPDNFYRLASGGTDSHVLIWHLTRNDVDSLNLEIAADLTRHQRAVNVVRWSPSGEYLASGDDESFIFIWKPKSDPDVEPMNLLDDPDSEPNKESWVIFKILRGHMEDVYDLSWSPNSLNLISGSVDNTAMVWDIQKGKHIGILNDHKGFVQGVAWDPKNQLLATLSTDRYFRVFDFATKKVLHRCRKSILPVAEDSPFHNKSIRIFHDDTLQTFYRRLCFSPDGNLIVTPAGLAESDGESNPMNTTYIFTRYSCKQPSVVLPANQFTIAVKFCPLLFELHKHDDDESPIIVLPYRMIFALATKSSVFLYDTQQAMPIGLISNIHYTRLTDLTWSDDGRVLIVSSTDGFCSLITFGVDELGVVYKEKISITTELPVQSEKEQDKNKNNLSDNTTKVEKSVEVECVVEITDSDSEVKDDSSEKSDILESIDIDDPMVTDDIDIRPVETAGSIGKHDTNELIVIIDEDDPMGRKEKEIGAEIETEMSVVNTNDTEIVNLIHDDSLSPDRNTKVDSIELSVNGEHPTIDDRENELSIIETPSKSVDNLKENSNAPINQSETQRPASSSKTTPTSTSKTPRRVQFRTISTPKSKKKLL